MSRLMDLEMNFPFTNDGQRLRYCGEALPLENERTYDVKYSLPKTTGVLFIWLTPISEGERIEHRCEPVAVTE